MSYYCAICYFVKYYSIYIDLLNYSIYNNINNRKQKPPGILPRQPERHQSKKKGSYTIAQVKRNEKNKQQGS
nr:MAG TPA: hypothetical protein [Bacteriophage sp.]